MAASVLVLTFSAQLCAAATADGTGLLKTLPTVPATVSNTSVKKPSLACPQIAQDMQSMPPPSPEQVEKLQRYVTEPVVHDRIDSLDSKFIELYESDRDGFLAHGDPIILFHRGCVTLINHGKVVEKTDYLPQEFQTLKTADHITLGIFVALVDQHDHLSSEKIAQLKDFLEAIDAARPQFTHQQYFSNTRAADRQLKIIDASSYFLKRVIEHQSCTRDQLNAYMAEMVPLSNENIKDAIGLDLSNLNKAVQRLIGLLSEDETRALKIVVFGSHMARTEESHWQYFSRLLDEPAEGDRIIYFEGNAEDKDGLALLGAHILDQQIGLEYFGSSWRMHRDLLSAAASRWLDDHPVKTAAMRKLFWP